MKKAILIIVNVCIILSIFAFVVTYSYVEHKNEYNNRVASFENMTAAMERITDNFFRENRAFAMSGLTT
ncbi:MAG: hypothetical protein K6F14_07425 [Clostridiales bacterium]|nr:hypothetical protein [Clostridiales bacterium]